ncbi:hypothetical protein RHSIM_Rhsim01G0226400 [Rhododendron simsii]|uniref:Osmotin-like protein n=1 Tax=Rhododendron simsii TaxID=118357 RepID=A0A834M0B6_RHOSS|nr:hypothetical protein RHSIM_Rhsim01G0226400 [Rhododendron simsii]
MSSSSSLLSLSCFSLLLTLIFTITNGARPDFIMTVVNNCPYPIWPAIQPNTGFPVLERGGFHLDKLSHRSFPGPAQHWAGRVWARTGCTASSPGHLSCATGDCGGRLECAGAGGAAPASLAEFSLHHGHKDQSSYTVSLVDGFNIPMTITPHEGQGNCPVVGCRADLLATCPETLQMRSPAGHGPVVGCKSGCEAFRTDALCCRNQYNSPQTCRPSTYSEFFKKACPATVTYGHDSPSLTHDCSSPRELKVIFCH